MFKFSQDDFNRSPQFYVDFLVNAEQIHGIIDQIFLYDEDDFKLYGIMNYTEPF